MKKILLFIVFGLSLFIASCGESEKHEHGYYNEHNDHYWETHPYESEKEYKEQRNGHEYEMKEKRTYDDGHYKTEQYKESK